MGQRNTPHNSHMIDFEADQQGQNHNFPDPCVFYGNLPTFPQPNVHTVVPVPGNALNTYMHPLPEQHENPLCYGMTHYNGTIHQRPPTNLDLAMATSSNHYNPYVAAPSAAREFPIPVIHGTHDHLPFTTGQGMVGIHTDGYGRNIPYADGVRGLFKRKNAEGIPMNFQYHHAMAGPSSAVSPVIGRVHEADALSVDIASRIPPDYGDSSLSAEDVSQRSMMNRSGVSGQETVAAAAHSSNHFIQGSYVGQAFPLPANPWLDMQLNGNQAALLPYVHGSMGGCVEAGNMGIQGYQATPSNGSLTSFMRPPIPQGFSSVHHLPPSIQGMGGHNINFPPQMPSSSRRHITNGPSSSNISPFPGAVEAGPGPRYMGPFPPTGFRLYRPHRRDFMVETRNRNIPNMRVLPEDGVAILEIPGYNEVGDSIDQHSDMRMDIDHMSYEELLALGEQIGCVTTGLSEAAIISLLKTRSFTSSATSYSNSSECLHQETDFCVICQNDYKDQEKIGIVECGHEYHVNCIKKWLVVKNSCPICKSTALSPGKTDL